MKPRRNYDLPPEKEQVLRRAIRLEWVTIGCLLSIIVVMYLTMGASQAMKTAWIEDVLSLIPPIIFLLAIRRRNDPPDERFPYGKRRSVMLSFIGAAAALSILGLYMIYDSATALLTKEHPTIGTFRLFGWQTDIWAGWVMIGALTYSAILPVILGWMKLPLARELHEKTLWADAHMNKADWMTAVAAIVGILGIGLGLWWADPVAALFIACDVSYDGFRHMKQAMSDLMDARPTDVEGEPEDLDEQIRALLRQLDWVEDAAVRLREEGHVFSGEAFVVPRTEDGLVEHLQQASSMAEALDWRLYEILIVPVPSLEDVEDGTRPAMDPLSRLGTNRLRRR